MTAPAAPRNHLPSLDGLRACAIILVIIAHMNHTLASPMRIASLFGDLGNLGVRVFFILSGFLITHLLLREEERNGAISLSKFYLRRVLRIFPAFYTFIALMAVAGAIGWIAITGRDELFAATFTANFLRDRSWYIGHTWSLAVEEQFYILWPTIFLLAGKRHRLTVAVATIVVAPLVRIGIFLAFPSWQLSIGELFPTIMDTIAIGAALALARQQLQARAWYRRALASNWCYLLPVAVLACNRFVTIFAWPGWLAGETVLNLCIAIGIDRALTHPGGAIGRALNLRWVAWIGTLSYSLYLWQQPFLPRSGTSSWQHLPLNLLAIAACALLSYYVVERPAILLKDRIGRARHA